ncbi:MAG: hypothetical protein KY396_03420 [Actinobacteria bacterium]|nr:hypothetical protein [Actinomycetota bacterium]
MRKIGVIAAALVVAFSIGFASRGTDGREASRPHSCGATDKRFIRTASINMTELGIWGAAYKDGSAGAEAVAEEARAAAKRVAYVTPLDPSLVKAQRFMTAMFSEYGEAVELYGEGKKAGDRMYRAYGLANFARDVLVDAQPALSARGCDLSPLL